MTALQILSLSHQTSAELHPIIDLVKNHIDLFAIVIGPEEAVSSIEYSAMKERRLSIYVVMPSTVKPSNSISLFEMTRVKGSTLSMNGSFLRGSIRGSKGYSWHIC